MKYTYTILIFLFSLSQLSAQDVFEGFEAGTLNSMISFQSVGTFTTLPGVVANTNFGSTNAFSFGCSTCGSNCFTNYETTLTITFPAPTKVVSIRWKEMEVLGNWGSQGAVLLDNVLMTSATLGALPINNNVADTTPRFKYYSVNQTVTSIKIVVTDITSTSEIIIDDLVVVTSPNIIGYEYWFNNDYVNKIDSPVSATQQLTISQNIATTGLAHGINVFNFRTYDSFGKYSAVMSSFFYKTLNPVSSPNSEIVAYEYWFDNDYANVVYTTTTSQSQIALNELIVAQLLANGVHVFNIRFKDNKNLWSSISSQFFYKMPIQAQSNNLITDYRYWLNNDFTNVTNVSLAVPVKQFSLVDNLDLTQVSKGIYTINFQFRDTTGLWSSVLTDTISKIAYPIADFSFATTEACDSTLVQFTDLSIDGDVYLWNFGDGNTDTSSSPSHAFYLPNTYQVSLTVTDTTLGTDSTIVYPIVVYSLSSSSSISEIVCDTYTAPDGQVYTTSGIKTAIIPNAVGCDSIITIDLTIWNSTTSSISEAVCDTYTAPDGQIYTTSGIKTAVIPNATGCDSIITIDLTIWNSTTSSISETVCDTYTEPDGQVYTTSGVKTAVIPNAAGCDSTITINLTINTVDASVTQSGFVLTANTIGASYQWLDCDKDYSEITDEVNRAFSATQNGHFAVSVTQNSCVDTSICYTITGVGILENNFDSDIVLYPNPTNGKITVNLGEVLDQFTVKILDLEGRVISESNYKNTEEFEMNIDASAGVYLMTIYSNKQMAVIRFVKD